MDYKRLVYGKDNRARIVSIEVKDNVATLYKENQYGVVTEKIESPLWALFNTSIDDSCIKLAGELHYKWAKKYDTYETFKQDTNNAKYAKKVDVYKLSNLKEMLMTRMGVTCYKGMRPDQVSILSFDIETTGLKPSENDKILLISNTYRDQNGNVERRLFSYDEFKSTKEMVYAWCAWVRDKDPSIICGHNIFNFDLPYIGYYVEKLPLGRDNKNAKTANFTSEFRKEGGQTYTFSNVLIPGREVIDTMHLAYKYDVATRKYSSYRLKTIIKEEGLEKEGRQHYDASQIRFNYEIPEEWDKIRKYAEEDGDDSLALFDLMIPSFFYYCQTLPKTLQQIINGASGAQVNSWMVRSYIQDGHSIPLPSERVEYEGAISIGNAGIYQNVKKVDVASLYPSIMREYSIYDRAKDPKKNFLFLVTYFTEERLKNKNLAKETGDRFYKDLEQSQKIFINSAYGFLGAAGLNFNSPSKAASVTELGREILTKGMRWAEGRGFQIVNADTDSFSYTGGDDFASEIEDLNGLFPMRIRWEDDGQYDSVLIVKAKNYALKTGGKIKIKGSGLKATMKETILRDFMDEFIRLLLDNKQDETLKRYENLVRMAVTVDKETIEYWSFKKTVTKSVLTPKRTTERRVLDAIKDLELQEGDKVRLFYKSDTELCAVDKFDGEYDKKRLLKKLFSTVKIFEPVINLKDFKNYALKRNEALLK